jgi:hypothetical protein
MTRSRRPFPLGDAPEVYIRREDAERFIEEIRGDDPETREAAADRGAKARGRSYELEPGCVFPVRLNAASRRCGSRLPVSANVLDDLD